MKFSLNDDTYLSMAKIGMEDEPWQGGWSSVSSMNLDMEDDAPYVA